MPEVERTVTTSTPLPQVWECLTGFRDSAAWDPLSVRTARTSGDGDVGTTYHHVSSFLGSETEVDCVVTEHVAQQRFQLRGDAGTSLDVAGHAEPRGRARRQDPGELPMPLGLALLADQVAESLQERLDALGGA